MNLNSREICGLNIKPFVLIDVTFGVAAVVAVAVVVAVAAVAA